MKHAKNSSLLHSYIPSLTLPLTLQVIPWSLQTKRSRTQLCGKKKRRRERENRIKKNPGQKKREAANEGEDKQAGTELTPKIDEEIVVASRLYSRVSITGSRLVQPTGKKKDITSRNALRKGRAKWKHTNGRRGQIYSTARGGILVQC